MTKMELIFIVVKLTANHPSDCLMESQIFMENIKGLLFLRTRCYEVSVYRNTFR